MAGPIGKKVTEFSGGAWVVNLTGVHWEIILKYQALIGHAEILFGV
jgi:hypothetical protein